MAPKRGRPPTPLDPTASDRARLGATLRTHRLEMGLTLQELADLIHAVRPQHISEVERAKVVPSQRFVTACDAALRTDGALLLLLPAAIAEREALRDERTAARRAARAKGESALRCDPTHSEAGDDEDVQPTNRRGLLGAGAAAALSVPVLSTAPAQARKIDPQLAEHWGHLLRILGRQDERFGPGDVLDAVQREIGVIAEHRAAARGTLRAALTRVEARWADLAAWLCEDTGRPRTRAAWTDYALQLAREADYADMLAFARGCRSTLSSDARHAVACAEDALRVPGASPQTRALCSRYAAIGHAKAGDAASCERHLAVAYGLLVAADSPPPPWAGEFRVTQTGTVAAEARCWLLLDPAKSIALHEDALRDWPGTEARDGGIVQARLALACAKAGELDRARAEGRKAFAIGRVTKSATVERELQRLGQVLKAA